MEKEEKVEKKLKELEKSNRLMKGILLSFIGIFFIGLCVGFGYFVGSSNSNNKENNNEEANKEENKNEVVKLTKDSDVVKKLFAIFKEDNCLEKDIYKNLNDSVDAKMYLAYSELMESDFTEMRCGDLNDSYIDGNYCAANDEAFKYYGSNELKFQQAIANEKTKVVSASLLEKKYKEIFGENANFTNKTFKLLEGPIAYYDSKNNVYAYFSCECGGDCGTSYNHTLNDIEQNGKTLKLNTTLVVDKVISLVVYTFEFEESTGNYIFVSREEKIDNTSALIARSAELKDNFGSLLGRFECESKEYKFSATGNSVLYKVKYQDSVKELINDTFVNTSVASKYVPFYENKGVLYSLNGEGGFLGSGYSIFEYEVVSEANDTAVVEVEYIECYDDEVHDKIDSCQNNPLDKVFTMKFELKKVNDKWLIEKMESEMIVPVVR